MSRIVVDIPTNKVLQVEKTPDLDEYRQFGGRYLLPVPDGAAVDVTASSYVLPQDGGDLAAQAAAALLARYPMYENIAYNFLLEAADINDLDLSATPAVSNIFGIPPITRAQTGRGSGPGPTGQVPTTTALLGRNNSVTPFRPGMLITDTIDIGPMTGGAGADEFMLWWQIYKANTTEDIVSDYGIFNGSNIPAERQIAETDQEPAALQVFISHDDGATWTLISRLEPTDLVVYGSLVRIAFLNIGTTRLYLAAYGVMF